MNTFIPPQPRGYSQPPKTPSPTIPPPIGSLHKDENTLDEHTLSRYPSFTTLEQEDTLNSNYKHNYNYSNKITNKSKVTAVVLALLIGGTGAHRFYLGQTGKGLLYLALLPFLISPLLALIDTIRYLIMSKDEFAQKYGVN